MPIENEEKLGRCSTCPTSSLVASSWARLKLKNNRQNVVAPVSLVLSLDELCEDILESIEHRRLVQHLSIRAKVA